jgi:hypothetical protein
MAANPADQTTQAQQRQRDSPIGKECPKKKTTISMHPRLQLGAARYLI